MISVIDTCNYQVKKEYVQGTPYLHLTYTQETNKTIFFSRKVSSRKDSKDIDYKIYYFIALKDELLYNAITRGRTDRFTFLIYKRQSSLMGAYIFFDSLYTLKR